MSNKLLFVLSTLLLFLAFDTSHADNIDIVYTSPKDGSIYLRTEETIIISANANIDENSLDSPGIIEASGKRTSNYPGTIHLSSDGKTIIFKPTYRFLHSDTVSVSIHQGIKTINGDFLNPKQITFVVRDSLGNSHFDSFASELGINNYPEKNYFHAPYSNPSDDPLPENFPNISITNNTAPSSGRLFFSNFNVINFNGGTGSHVGGEGKTNLINTDPYLIIYDRDSVFFQKRMSRYGLDFKVNRNGDLVYFAAGDWKYFIMDTNYNVIDSVSCGHGYQTDGHDLLFLPNGHMLVMSYDPVWIDMSTIVQGGYPNALVTGLIVQELDNEKNVVFQWRSWDNFRIIDAIHENLTAGGIDYVHGNAIEPDLDGNLLISSRHLDEITKINRTTGGIIWRMGGVNNEFTFLNDPRGFTYQHDVRRVAPGRITLFDNGNHHSPPYTRVVEYEVDEVNKTAKLVWEFDHNKEIFAFAMGNAQRLSNGNTLIGWGAGYPSITEVDPNGNIVFELTMPDSLWTYRAFRFNFKQSENIIPENYSLNQNYPNPFNPTTTISFDIPNSSTVSLKIYDVLGREVDELIHENLVAGNYNITWNAQNLSSGVYFYSIYADNFTETKKMILLK